MEETYYLSGTASSSMAVSEQFKDFVSALNKRGLKLNTSFPSKYLICINHNSKIYTEFIRSGGKPENAAIIFLEPYAVYPAQYSQKNLQKYAILHAPGNPSFKDCYGRFIPWPYQAMANPCKPYNESDPINRRIKENDQLGLFDYDEWVKRENFLTLINTNKVSAVKNENYRIRRAYAHILPSNLLKLYGDLWVSPICRQVNHRLQVLLFNLKSGFLPNLFSIYGNLHWRYESAKGPLVDKQISLQSFKFSIVIENDSSYISEKMIDVMINGCIPIYYGPKDIDSIIPRGTYLELPSSPLEIVPMLQKLSSSEVQDLLISIKQFVTSQEFTQKWNSTNVFSQLANSIVNQLGKKYG